MVAVKDDGEVVTIRTSELTAPDLAVVMYDCKQDKDKNIELVQEIGERYLDLLSRYPYLNSPMLKAVKQLVLNAAIVIESPQNMHLVRTAPPIWVESRRVASYREFQSGYRVTILAMNPDTNFSRNRWWGGPAVGVSSPMQS